MDWGLFVRHRQTGQWGLRSRRLYPRKSFYWAMVIVNTLLRFCWTLSFVPLRYLSAAGVLTENFSSDTWASILTSTLASAEIIRRTLWGLLRVEWEAIKVRGELHDSGRGSGDGKDILSDVADEDDAENGHGLEMTPMKMPGGISHIGVGGGGFMSWQQRMGQLKCTSDMSSMSKIQILGELCLYTAIFAVVGLVAAAHRETL